MLPLYYTMLRNPLEPFAINATPRTPTLEVLDTRTKQSSTQNHVMTMKSKAEPNAQIEMFAQPKFRIS